MTWANISDMRFRLDGEPITGVVCIAFAVNGESVVHTSDGSSFLGTVEATSEPEPSKDDTHG